MPIADTSHALWERLRTFDFDRGPSAFTFRDRLARDAGWSRAFAGRVVEEYRRFLFLAAAAGHPVTPSDEVDQAWHLHLTYTRSYWDDLCGQVLPAPLHHDPTRGGATEGTKFHDWYERTRESYRRLFDAEPPADIWPPAAIRFARRTPVIQPQPRAVWLVPKPAWWPPRRRAVLAAIALAVATTSACAAAESGIAVGLFVLGAVACVAFVAASNHRAQDRPARRNDEGGTGCSSASTRSSSDGSGSSPDSQECGDGNADCGDSGGGDSGGGDGGSGCGGGGGD